MSGVNTGVPQEPPKDFLLFVAELHIREAVVGMLKYKTRGRRVGAYSLECSTSVLSSISLSPVDLGAKGHFS